MSRSRQTNPIRITVRESNSPLGFATTGGGPYPVWDRFITINGERTFHIGNVCGTCPFFFERLTMADESLGPRELREQLTNGLDELSPSHIKCLEPLLPNGTYHVSLGRTHPRLVAPGSQDDYFYREQATLWIQPGNLEPPHDTKMNYYRGEDRKLGGGAMLFEFMVPLIPETQLDQERIGEFASRIRAGVSPTALAISVLDVNAPADWDGDPEINTHWCLAHYLIDGHHKVYAAHTLGRPISFVSMLAIDQGIAHPEHYRRLASL